MVGQLNFFVFKEGESVTAHCAETLYPGFVKFDGVATKRVRNTVAGEEPDGFVSNTFASGNEKVTVYKKDSVVNMYFDDSADIGAKVTTGNRGMARGVDGFTSGQSFGTVIDTATSGSTGTVWINL